MKTPLLPTLVFAMNGGMFQPDYSPTGLYVENGVQLKGITRSHDPNFNYGIQPQGVFRLKTGKAQVIPIDQYTPDSVQYATESAPMLVINGRENPNLPNGTRRATRNGVGILPDGRVFMAVSRDGVTFREFADLFKENGCVNAMYLDGGISGCYTPGTNDPSGRYGVMVGVVGH